MQWITLIGDKNFNLNVLKSLKYNGSINCYDVSGFEQKYCVDFGTDHIFYDYITDITDFEDDLDKIPYLNPRFITMVYTSELRLKSILLQNDFPSNIYIDNDYGLIAPIKKFIELGMPLGRE